MNENKTSDGVCLYDGLFSLTMTFDRRPTRDVTVSRYRGHGYALPTRFHVVRAHGHAQRIESNGDGHDDRCDDNETATGAVPLITGIRGSAVPVRACHTRCCAVRILGSEETFTSHGLCDDDDDNTHATS